MAYITNWTQWMKKNHVKVYTEEELEEMKRRKTRRQKKGGMQPGSDETGRSETKPDI